MKLTKLYFENYKAFAGEHELELRPLTIIIGRNNSGKSALARLPLLLREVFMAPLGQAFTPQRETNHVGNSLADLIYEKPPSGWVTLGASFEDDDGAEHKLCHEITIQRADDGDNHKLVGHEVRVGAIALRIEEGSGVVAAQDTSNDQTITFDPKLTRKSATFGFEVSVFDNLPMVHGDSFSDEATRARFEQADQTINKSREWPPIYYLPATRPAPRDKVNIKEEKDLYTEISKLLFQSQRAGDDLLRQINGWYEDAFDRYKLSVAGDEEDVRIVMRRGAGATHHIRDAGSALAQTLPVVTYAKILAGQEEPRLFIVEEPESNLHPRAHGALTELFMDMLKQGHTTIVETHSEIFCLRTQLRVAEGKIKPEDVVIYFVESAKEGKETDGATLTKLFVSEKGVTYKLSDGKRIRYWPEGVFSEDVDEITALHELRYKI
jgi:hypothetical protein